MDEIRFLTLRNTGAFVARLRVHSKTDSYNLNEDICAKQERTVDLANVGSKIKDGDEVWLEAVVKAGKNKTAKQHFIYRRSSNKQASFKISGTTLINTLSYNGRSDFFEKITEPIRCITLRNIGAFVTRIRIKSDTQSFNVNKDITALTERNVDLADVVGNIKDGDEFWLEAVVVAGYNNTARQHFVYQKNSDNKAYYTISGTTLINTLTYNGLFKIGSASKPQAGKDELIKRIDNWTKTDVKSAWTDISQREVANELKTFITAYFDKTNKYTNFCSRTNPKEIFGEKNYTKFHQGKFSTCGPSAVLFYLAKLNIGTFVDTIIQLYAKGSFMGYDVPKKLRSIKLEGKMGEHFEDVPNGLAKVCWMMHSALDQKESILDIKLQKEPAKMHTRPEEMIDDINFVFNATGVKKQLMANWSTVSKAKDNFKEWVSCIKQGGVVFWLTHADPINDILYADEDRVYLRTDIHDLHWVVVLSAEEKDGEFEIKLHTWNKLVKVSLSPEKFRRMTFDAITFRVK